MKVDLHMHSTCSDGSDSVETIIDKAVNKGLELISITDHDNAQGQARAIEYSKGKIGYMTGIELSTYDQMEIHILGYGYDHTSKVLNDKTRELLDLRVSRIRNILKMLNEQGVLITEDDLDMKFAGRLQIAKVMVKKRYAQSVPDAFNRYLGVNGSAYIPSNRLKPKDAVKLIVGAGGRPVIAHPEKYLNSGILIGLIEELLPLGLRGLECHYSSHSEETTARLSKIARRYGLIETVGSDYHGTNGINDIGQVKYELDRKNVSILAGRTI